MRKEESCWMRLIRIDHGNDHAIMVIVNIPPLEIEYNNHYQQSNRQLNLMLCSHLNMRS